VEKVADDVLKSLGSFVVGVNAIKYQRKQGTMNPDTTRSEYMLLFRGNEWYKGLSPEQTQQVMGDWMSWFERLTQEGKCKAGHPLEPEGKIVSGKKGRVVADGPFAESKEAIGGYFFLQVDSLDEAVAIARQCPGLDYGAVVEVRPVAPQCPMADGATMERAMAQVTA